MLKKLFSFFFVALFSLNASAGYIRYDFSGPTLSGYFVQRDTDKSIADYYVRLDDFKNNLGASFSPFPSAGFVKSAFIYNGQIGPTTFSIEDYNSDAYANSLALQFVPSKPGDYDVLAYYSRTNMFNLEGLTNFKSLYLSRVTLGAVSDAEARNYDEISEHVLPRVVPQRVNVPEPASLALLALGLVGAFVATRRKRSL